MCNCSTLPAERRDVLGLIGNLAAASLAPLAAPPHPLSLVPQALSEGAHPSEVSANNLDDVRTENYGRGDS